MFGGDPSDGASLPGNSVDGNPPGFEAVLRQFHKRIYNFAYRLIGDADEAADLTQEAFVNAYKAYGRFQGSSQAVYPWLCKILVNGCKNKFREMNRRGRYEILSLDEPLESGESRIDVQIGDLSSSPEGVLQRRELEARIQESIQMLPPEYRIVVVLRDMQGLSYKEISDVTGITMENVKARLFRARAALRRKLQTYIQD
jgi:RNA polymerase sigma-70 factor (ECF subfamily)